MIKTITLQQDNIARIDDLSVFYAPDELVFRFQTESYDISKNAFFVCKNGQKEYKSKIINGEVNIPREIIFAGELCSTVYLYNESGEVVNEWHVYPFKIVEVNGQTYIYDEIKSLEERIRRLEDRQPKNIF